MTKSKKNIPLDADVVEKIARKCSTRAMRGEFTIIYSAHAKEQMEKRRIEQKDVLQVLEFGRLVEEQTYFNEKENDFSYLLRDQDVDQRDMAVAISIINHNGDKIIIITAMIIDPITGRFI